MAKFYSRRLEGLAQSDIRFMSRECDRVGGINLGQGLCDLPTPPSVAAATKQAIDDRRSMYTYPEGALELRQAIATKLKRDNHIEADPQGEIVVTVGSTGAFAAATTGLLNQGDGILLLEPYYGYHLNAAIVAGLVPQFLALEPPQFTLHEQALRDAIQPNTRAVVICTPSNPSGKMFSQEELEIVARVAEQHDLLVISDEIYEYIRYDDTPHISPASVANLWDRTVSIMGLSKTFSITGWRLGYAVAPRAMADVLTLVSDLYYVCAPTPLQHGVMAGFSLPSTFFETLREDYQRMRDLLCGALKQAHLNPIVPQGAYYVLADVGHLGYATAREAAMALLTQCGVASVPGSAFYRGATGERLLRFCFSKEEDVLSEACSRVLEFTASAE